MDVMAAAAEKEAAGDTVIHLEVGQPSTPAPKAALAAAHAALDTDRIGYVAALGMPALRERIARHYRDTYAAEVSPERVIVTTGSSGGFPLAFLASFDAGDRVALAAPGYPAYRNILAALNLEAVDLPTSAADRFQPTVAALEKAGTDRRPDRGEPVQSDRHDGEPLGAESVGRLVRCTRRAADLRRDLSRHRLRGRNHFGGRGLRPCHRGQQLLQVFLDDRLAGRLADRARRAGAADRAADAELLHLGADAQPACRARRLRRPRRARRPRRGATRPIAIC